MYKLPLNISFELTNSCNNNCPHCYATNWINKPQKSIDIVNIAKILAEYEVFDIILTGGEALLLDTKKLTHIIDVFTEKNISLSLNTNGRLLSPGKCRELNEHGLISLLISLHSWDNDLHDEIVGKKGAAHETKNGIINALENDFHVTVNQVIDKRNIQTMFRTAKNLEYLGVNAVAMTRSIPPLNFEKSLESVTANEFIDEFIKCKSHLKIVCNSLLPFCYCSDERVAKEMLGLNCSGGIYSATVSNTGEVRLCVHDTNTWGNILDENLEVIWKRLVEWRTEISVPHLCKECVFLPDCMGGCRVNGKYHTGSYTGMDSWAIGPRTDLIREIYYEQMNFNKEYLLSPHIRYREENNGFLLFNKSKSLYVNNDGLEFLNMLPNKFIPNKIIELGGANSDLFKNYIEDLYKKMFLIEI